LDIRIEDDGRTSITLYDPAQGSRLDKDFIMNQLNDYNNFAYEQMALGLQDYHGNDSVNCGKYIILFILYLSNYEKNKGPSMDDGFQIIDDDGLEPLIRNSNFSKIKTLLFDTLQKMIHLDNQSINDQVEAMNSKSVINGNDEFEIIEGIAAEQLEAMRLIEKRNIMDLQKISFNIENVLGFLDQKPKHADKIKTEKNIIKGKIHR